MVDVAVGSMSMLSKDLMKPEVVKDERGKFEVLGLRSRTFTYSGVVDPVRRKRICAFGQHSDAVFLCPSQA